MSSSCCDLRGEHESFCEGNQEEKSLNILIYLLKYFFTEILISVWQAKEMRPTGGELVGRINVQQLNTDINRPHDQTKPADTFVIARVCRDACESARDVGLPEQV